MTPLIPQFDLLATAPGGVARLRELILTLAVQGKLVPQEAGDEPASVLLQRIRAEKDRLIAAGKIKREKLIPEIREDERTTDAPNGWELVRLGTLIELISGQHLGPTEYVEGLTSEIPYLTGPAEFGSISPEPTRSTVERRAIAVQGDILITVKGAGVGKLNVVLHSEIAISRQLMAIRPIGVNGKFLFIVLKSLGAKFLQQAIGIAIPGIGRDDVAFSVLGLPPLAEQSRIVTRVEELMRLCDALEQQRQLETAQHAQLLNTLLGTLTNCTSPDELAAHWQRVSDHFDLLLDRPEAVDALEQTILQLAVRGLLVPQDPADEPASVLLQRIRAEKDRLIAAGKIKRDKPLPAIPVNEIPFELPVDWKWVRLGAVGESFDYGTSQKTGDNASAVPVLRMGNIQDGKIVLNNLKYLIDQEGDLPKLFLRPDDLLFNRTNSFELVGKTARFEGHTKDMSFASYLIRIRLVEALCDPDYINFYMNTTDCRKNEIVPDLTQQTGQANYNGTKLKNIRIPLPPLAEQTRIVARVTELRHLCTALRQRLAARQTTQRHLAEALVEV